MNIVYPRALLGTVDVSILQKEEPLNSSIVKLPGYKHSKSSY